MKLNIRIICPLVLAAIVSIGSGVRPCWSKDHALIQKLAALHDNQFETRLMLANYSVDWGEYPASLQELYQAAKKGQYWKALSNPITGQTTYADLGMDYAQYRPDVRHAGKVLYEPLRNAAGKIYDFRLFAVNDEGRLYKFSGKIHEYSDHSNYQPTGLHAAAAAGQLATLQKASLTALNALDRFGMTPLMWAALNRRTETVHWLRAKGARFAPENRAGYGEAYLAVKSGDSDWVNEAIVKEKDLHYEDEQNTSALVLATQAGRLDWVQAMLDKGAPGAEKALQRAVEAGNDDLFKLLLDSNLNYQFEETVIAMVMAAEAGQIEWVRAMMKDKGVPGADKALVGAVISENDELFTFLLEPGKAGIQAALIAAANYGDQAKAKILLEKGARADQPDSEGSYPLEIASSEGNVEVVKVLLANGADVNAHNTTDGWTALMRASYTSKIEVLNALLSHGAKLDLSNHKGETAMIIVAQGFSADVMQWLIQQGADPSLQDQSGHNAGYYASDKPEFKPLMAALRDTDTDLEFD